MYKSEFVVAVETELLALYRFDDHVNDLRNKLVICS